MKNTILNPSMVTLPALLESRNQEGKYTAIIEKAKRGCYHDFKFDLVDPECSYPCPKLILIEDLSAFPELKDISDMVITGEFDDRADEEDKQRMREELKDNPMLRDLLGL